MDAHIKKVYVPMTETGFYILLCLQKENHGYGIVQKVKEMTKKTLTQKCISDTIGLRITLLCI